MNTSTSSSHDSPDPEGVQPSELDSATTEEISGADETETQSTDPEAEGATGDEPADETDEFLTADERKELEAIKDPTERIKGFEKAYFRKTRQLADRQKALAPVVDFYDAYRKDPLSALQRVAQENGLELKDPRAKATEETIVNLDGQIDELAKKHLGDEYEDLAGRLGPLVREVAELVAKHQTETLTERTNRLVEDSARREMQATVDAFAKKHPDLKEHEDRMAELMKEFPPGIDPKTGEPIEQIKYLEGIYKMAKNDAGVGAETKRVVERMTRSAAAARKEAPAVGHDKVSAGPVGLPSFRDAFEAADRGERLE